METYGRLRGRHIWMHCLVLREHLSGSHRPIICAPMELDSWGAIAYDLLTNRLKALGQVSMFIENYTEEIK